MVMLAIIDRTPIVIRQADCCVTPTLKNDTKIQPQQKKVSDPTAFLPRLMPQRYLRRKNDSLNVMNRSFGAAISLSALVADP